MKVIEVVTRYGNMHLARMPEMPYRESQRHYTLCSGTSAWTRREWLDNFDHPLLTRDEMLMLEMDCQRCMDF